MADTYGDISQRTGTYAEAAMLAHAQPIILLEKYAQIKPLPKNKADNVTFRRPVPFTVSTTQLTEGVTPTAKSMSYEDVPVTLGQYGGLVEITDKVHDLCEDPVLNDASRLSGEEAAETKELITWNVLRGGTNVFYANGSARGDVNTPISRDVQRKIVRSLKAQRARKVTKILGATVKISTRPVNAAYIAFAHTDLEPDIRDLPGFTPVEEYANSGEAMEHEIGKCEEVRYLLSPVFTLWPDAGAAHGGAVESTTGTLADVYPIIYIGAEAFGAVPLKGQGAMSPYVCNPDKREKSDPLGQRGFVSWKGYFAAVRLNEAWMVRAEVAASLL